MNTVTEELLKEAKAHEDAKKRLKLNSSYIFDDAGTAQIIPHALGRFINGENRIRYFGSKLPIKMVTKEGEKTQMIPVIVTEDRRILSSFKNDEIKFELLPLMTLAISRWDKLDIEEFVNEKTKDVTYKQAYDAFKRFYDENMVFENPVDYKLNPLWDLLTYHWDLIDKSLFIKEEGPSGSAKSKTMKISSNLSFNGRKWLKPNPANFYRYRHSNKSTIYLEEVERLFDESKKHQQGDDILVEYLNGSYERGNHVPRQNVDNPNITEEFDPFGFTQLGSINPFPIGNALTKRCVVHTMVVAKRGDNRANTEVPSETNPEYVNARALAYISSLLHYKEFLANLDNIQNKYELANRDWIQARPLLALAETIDPTLTDEIGTYLTVKLTARNEPLDCTSWEVILATVILSGAAKEKGKCFLSNDFMENRFNEMVNLDTSDTNTGGGVPRRVTFYRLGRTVTKLGLAEKRGYDSKKENRGLNVSFYGLCELFLRNGVFDSIDKITKIVSGVSECPYSGIDVSKWYVDTYTDTTQTLTTTTTDTTLIVSGQVSEPKKQQIILGGDLFDFIKNHDSGDGVNTHKILHKFNAENNEGPVFEKLEKLKQDGAVFECKPDYWKVAGD